MTKRYPFTLLLLLFLIPNIISAQSDKSNDICHAIATIFKSGKTAQLEAYLDLNVQLSVGDSEGIYSKHQAVKLISNFLDEKKVIDYMRKDVSNGNYCFGIIKTEKGDFQVYYKSRSSNNKELIYDFKISSK